MIGILKPFRLKGQLTGRNIDLCSIALVITDLFAFLLSALISNAFLYWLIIDVDSKTFDQIWTGSNAELRAAIFTTLLLVALFWFYLAGHYTKRRPFWDEIAHATRIIVILAASDAVLLYLFKLQFSRFWFLTTWTLIIPLLPISRSIMKDFLIRQRRWQRPTIILGTGYHAGQICKALKEEPMMGLTPVAFASNHASSSHERDNIEGIDLPIITLQELSQFPPERSRKTALFVAIEDGTATLSPTLIQNLTTRFPDVRLVPPVTSFPLYGARVHHLFRQELFFLTIRNNLGKLGPRIVKRTFDIVISSLTLIALLPILLAIYIVVRSDGGSAFFAHRRIGMRGEAFDCYKFRSMVPNAQQVLDTLLENDRRAQEEWNQFYKLKNDPRITKFGHWLRCSSFDELPQLWNVLLGNMSLVGPRPIVSDELERYGDDSIFYLETRPGMTGVWQVSGRNDTDYSFRVFLDAWYAKNWSLWYDIVILVKTIRVVLKRQGAY